MNKWSVPKQTKREYNMLTWKRMGLFESARMHSNPVLDHFSQHKTHHERIQKLIVECWEVSSVLSSFWRRITRNND